MKNLFCLEHDGSAMTTFIPCTKGPIALHVLVLKSLDNEQSSNAGPQSFRSYSSLNMDGQLSCFGFLDLNGSPATTTARHPKTLHAMRNHV